MYFRYVCRQLSLASVCLLASLLKNELYRRRESFSRTIFYLFLVLMSLDECFVGVTLMTVMMMIGNFKNRLKMNEKRVGKGNKYCKWGCCIGLVYLEPNLRQ